MYTLENCEKLWEESGQHGTPEQRIERARLWEPYYSLMAAPLLDGPPDQKIPEPPFVKFLAAEGILNRDTTVLDIGAGTGNYTMFFANICREVTALEPVERCVEEHRNDSADLSVCRSDLHHPVVQGRTQG